MSLKEIASLIAKTRPDSLTKREKELRGLILGRPWTSEKDLAYILWPDDKHQMEYLRQTKERLFRHVETVIFDLKDLTPFSDCYKKLAAVQILKSAGKRKEMIFLAERLLKKALRYEVTDVVVDTADILYLHYGSLERDLTKAKKYRELIETQEAIQLAERKAQRHYVELAGYSAKPKIGKQKTMTLAQKYTAELECELEKYQSFRYHYFSYLVLSIDAQLREDKERLIDVCNQALLFFQGKTYPIPNVIMYIFGFEKRASLALQTKDYAFARRAVKMGMELMVNSPYNFSICLIYKVMIGFHQGDDQLVREAIKESRDYRTFPALAEQWRIIDAFAHFLEIEADRPFRLGKFLNEVPIFSQDKQGLNITILVIQVLFYIKRKRYGALIDRWEALQKYTSRYLKRDHTFRSACFLKMILVLPAQNFHPGAVERHVAPYLEKLKAHPEGSDIEIVPYERLWKEVMICIKSESRYAK